MKISNSTVETFLEGLRKRHIKLHKKYEELFWISYMGDHSTDAQKNKAERELNAFYSDNTLKKKTELFLNESENLKMKESRKESLVYWQRFFSLYQTPVELLDLRGEISLLESKMLQRVSKRKEGYIHPIKKKFVSASYLKMRTMMRTNKDEAIREACFEAIEDFAHLNLKDYVKYVSLLNKYARALGHEDFYAYKIKKEEGMTKKELFSLFDSIYEKTKYALKDIRAMEKKQKGLRKPWNYGYMLSGDFTKEEDQYFPFSEALTRWGKSFTALGIDFRGGTLQLDLLDRKGKYANGFCHWPTLVHYNKGKRISGSSNFTCTVVYGEIGSASLGYNTLFHEGGHCAHFLNTQQKDTCLNHEYPPMSTAWTETQSMFLDTIFSSYEWKSRYAKNEDSKVYPFDLFERKVNKLNATKPTSLYSIIMIASFEREIYETKELTENKVIMLAKKNAKKYLDFSEDTLRILNVPHIYSWSSTCSYHGYGLADLAVHQWRSYFKKKYTHIVDNPKIGKEMLRVWKLGASKDFKTFVLEATGKKLSAVSWIKEHTASVKKVLTDAKKDAVNLTNVPHTNKTKFNASIAMVHGKKVISTNKKSFEDMSTKYAEWLNKT